MPPPSSAYGRPTGPGRPPRRRRTPAGRRAERERRLAARRRLLTLALAALAAFVLGAIMSTTEDDGGDQTGASSEQGGDERPAPPGTEDRDLAAARKLPLRKAVGELLILAFDGPERPIYVRDILREGRAAGAILFGDNAVSPGQLRALTRQLQADGGRDLLIAVDQEGGEVRIVPWAPPEAPQTAQSTPALAGGAARSAAGALRGLGINVNLAPVADVATPTSAFTGRVFPGDAAGVSRLVRASVEGYRDTRVAPTAKHFPGLGAAETNTDEEPTTVDSTLAELRQDLRPFAAAIDVDVPLVMAGHARYPALDARALASQSRRILTGILRDELGFEGAVMTDSLEAEAVISERSVEEAAARSFAAGADLLLMTGPGSYPLVFRRLLADAERSPATRERVYESAARVLALKRELGLRRPE